MSEAFTFRPPLIGKDGIGVSHFKNGCLTSPESNGQFKGDVVNDAKLLNNLFDRLHPTNSWTRRMVIMLSEGFWKTNTLEALATLEEQALPR